MAINQFVDRTILPLPGDDIAKPRYNLVRQDGTVVAENVALELTNDVLPGTPLNAANLNILVNGINNAPTGASGSWTPQLGTEHGVASDVTYTYRYGSWWRVGTIVLVLGYIVVADIGSTTSSSNSGWFAIHDLPFINRSARTYGTISPTGVKLQSTAGSLLFYVQQSDNFAHLRFVSNATAPYDVAWSDFAANGMRLEFSLIYAVNP